MTKKFHHIAIVVKDLEDKIPFFCDVYNADLLGPIYFDKNQLVKVQFIQSSDIKIELLEPMNSKSPISKFLNDHGSGSFYHIAYEVDNLDLIEKEVIQKKGKTPRFVKWTHNFKFIIAVNSFYEFFNFCVLKTPKYLKTKSSIAQKSSSHQSLECHKIRI